MGVCVSVGSVASVLVVDAKGGIFSKEKETRGWSRQGGREHVDW